MYYLNPTDNFQITTPTDTYIYDIITTSSGLAVLSSDDSLRILDPLALNRCTKILKDVGDRVTCLAALEMDSVVSVAGRNGNIQIWDLRTGDVAGSVTAEKNVAILSMAVCTHSLACGFELAQHEASVFLWDLRQRSLPLLKYTHSHSDDITDLQYHPSRPNILLSGSTDGLLNIYNTTFHDEEDALCHTINHGSSIHRCDFLSDLEIYALSHDEKFSTYEIVTTLEGDNKKGQEIHFGDVRKLLGGEYVAKIVRRPDGCAVMGIGTHSQEKFDLVQLKNQSSWSLSGEEKVILSGAHGSDIVRSFCFLDNHRTIFTCGEDGQVKAWKGE